jgi:phosphate transport system substrate-binding protein
MRGISVLILTLILFISSCSRNKNVVRVDGSSTVYPITEAVAEEFSIENRKSDLNIKVTIGVSGTGGGFKKFIRKELDVTEASRPIKATEDEKCKKENISYIELPVAYDGLVIVVNPANNWVNKITVKELKMIWEPSAQGKIKYWNQIRSEWPAEEIHLFGAGTESGTFDYFTEAIVGKAKSCRGDYTASEDDNVLVQGISRDKNALGFFGLGYYKENKEKLKLIPLDDEKDENGKGPVVPSDQTIREGSYQPLSRPLLIYINKASAEKPDVDKFIKFFISHAPELVSEVGFIPLSAEAYSLVLKKFQKRIPESIFLKMKSSVGVRMEDVLKTE